MLKRVTIFFALLSFLSSQFCQNSPLFNENIYNEAIDKLKNSKLDESLSLFQRMINPSSSKEIWTCQAFLVCDVNDLPLKSETLIKATSRNIIVIKRVIDSKECFRLCVGIFKSKTEAVELAKRLPSPFKEAKPYPLLLAKNGNISETAFVEQITKPSVLEQTNQKENQLEKPVEQLAVSEKVETKRDFAEELFLRGLKAYSENDLKSAENYFRQSIALRPSRVESYNNLGAIFLEQKRYSEAKTVLEQAVSIQPNYANARANLAGAYWYLGMKEEAIKEAERAFKLDAGNVKHSLNLASFLYELGKYNEAKTYINVAKIISPGNPDIVELNAKIDEKLGIKEEVKDTEKTESKDKNKEKSTDKNEEMNKESGSEEIKKAPPSEKEKKGLLRRIFEKKQKDKEEEKD